VNVLFFMKCMHIGGQESVTITLANYFILKGHNISIVSFEKPWDAAVKKTDSAVHFYTLGEFKYSRDNVLKLSRVLRDEKVDVVINQWGLPYVPAKVLKEAIKKSKLNIKSIAVYHNDPCMNARVTDVDIALHSCSNSLKRILLLGKKFLFKKITSKSMRYVYNHSDQYLVLSPSHIEHFRSFTGIKNLNRINSLANPLTVDPKDYEYKFDNKQKEIVYCGRIDFNQKRVCRVIETWALLESSFPDWRLTIVGDGESRNDVESLAKSLKLKRVCFEGFQNPVKYYQRASILLLTSEYEGFGLVLIEGMCFGVVPCVYGSYSAVYDIVEDEKNGIIVEKTENGLFSAKKMANRLAEVMSDGKVRDAMAQNAIETSKFYSIDCIYQQWMDNLNRLL